MFAFPFTCVFILAFASISVGGNVMRSTTGIPAVFRSMSRFATVLARVDVYRARVGRAGRAISSLVLVFTFAFLLPFLRESTCILSSSALVSFPDDTVGFAPKFRDE